jgi:MFS family permease
MQGMLLHFISGSLPLIFAENNVPLEKLGFYSLTTIFFSLKILFAPFVDIFYSNRIGKRKRYLTSLILSYIVPINYAISVIFLVAGNYIEDLIHNERLLVIGAISGACSLLIAVQDVAVDSWALEMMPGSLH